MTEHPLVVDGTVYPPSVQQALNVRGLAVLGKTASQLRQIGYFVSHAEEDGWTVDRHCYPWVAYVGPRFDCDAFLFMFTEDDE